METRTLEFVAEQLRRSRDAGRKATLIAGPFCSTSAGIPDAAAWSARVRERFPEAIAALGENPSAAAILAAIGPGHARALVEEAVAAAHVNASHAAIADLIRSGFVDRVLTPNIDNLLLRACAEKGIFPAVYDLSAAERVDLPEPWPSPSIVHLQGQRSGFVLLDHDEARALHAARLAPLFRRDAAGTRPLLVVGHGGEEGDPLLTLLASTGVFEYHLFWVAEGDAPLSLALVSAIGAPRTRAVAIPGFTADTFLEALARTLGAREAAPVESAPAPEAIVAAPAPVAEAVAEVEPEPEPLPEPEPEPAPSRSLLERVARESAAIAAVPEPPPANGNGTGAADPARARELLERAVAIGTAATARGANGEAERLYSEAESLFDAAAHADAETTVAEALDRWGALLLERGKRAPFAEDRDRFFAAAAEKCAAANASRAGAGAYNLACIAALRGLSSEAREWLESGALSGALPRKAHLLADTDLDAVRSEPWFTALVARAGE